MSSALRMNTIADSMCPKRPRSLKKRTVQLLSCLPSPATGPPGVLLHACPRREVVQNLKSAAFPKALSAVRSPHPPPPPTPQFSSIPSSNRKLQAIRKVTKHFRGLPKAGNVRGTPHICNEIKSTTATRSALSMLRRDYSSPTILYPP